MAVEQAGVGPKRRPATSPGASSGSARMQFAVAGFALRAAHRGRRRRPLAHGDAVATVRSRWRPRFSVTCRGSCFGEETAVMHPNEILVPVDFSPASDAALAHALTVADACGAEVEML